MQIVLRIRQPDSVDCSLRALECPIHVSGIADIARRDFGFIPECLLQLGPIAPHHAVGDAAARKLFPG
jgi:hypothetical protein